MKKFRKSPFSIVCYVFAAIFAVYFVASEVSAVITIQQYYASYQMSASVGEYITYMVQSGATPLTSAILIFMAGLIYEAIRKQDPANWASDEEITEAAEAKRLAREAKQIAKGEAAKAAAELKEEAAELKEQAAESADAISDEFSAVVAEAEDMADAAEDMIRDDAAEVKLAAGYAGDKFADFAEDADDFADAVDETVVDAAEDVKEAVEEVVDELKAEAEAE